MLPWLEFGRIHRVIAQTILLLRNTGKPIFLTIFDRFVLAKIRFQKSDVASTLELLRRCSPYYHSGELTADCLNNPRPCVRVPRDCITYNAVYTILHYLTDHDFMSPTSVSQNYVLLMGKGKDLNK